MDKIAAVCYTDRGKVVLRMKSEKTVIAGIPALIWGESSERAYLHVHGKQSRKEYAEPFAIMAERKGFQTVSFDLPEHGERSDNTEYRCDIWNGMRDLETVSGWMDERWKSLSLYGCSLGAYFSLNAFADRKFDRCLLQSPIVDMDELARNMMLWFGVTEERLEREGEIPTPVDPLRWDYLQYVRAHPVARWDSPTFILYGAKDDMQSRGTVAGFARRFGCDLTISETSAHPFMEKEDAPIVENWLKRCL